MAGDDPDMLVVAADHQMTLYIGLAARQHVALDVALRRAHVTLSGGKPFNRKASTTQMLTGIERLWAN